MPPRFTIIQGGLSEASRPGPVPLAPSAAEVWRVVLRRPAELREAEIDEWRALAARVTDLDPFSDPDFLATAALHAPRDDTVAFALAFSAGEDRIERLRGVVPLALSHPVWGAPAAALWQAPHSPRPVEPVFERGAAAGAMEAVLANLAEANPRASLRLSGIDAAGALLAELRAAQALRIAERETAPSIPEAQFVTVGARVTVTRRERIAAPDRIRDAVERFLLADAHRSRRPLLPDPAAASILRVVTRLFARRGLVEVELNSASGEVVSGAIRLGREGERRVWRSVGLDEAVSFCNRTVDVEVAPAGAVERHAGLRLVVS